jgi:phage-related protein (TIGR01555 family)
MAWFRKKQSVIDKKENTPTEKINIGANFWTNINDITPNSTQDRLFTKIFDYKNHYKNTFDKQTNNIKSNMFATDNNNAYGMYNMPYDCNVGVLNGYNFLGFAQLSLLSQIPLIYNSCDTYASEMLRTGFELICTDDNVDLTDELKLLKKEWERYKLDDAVKRMLVNSFRLGGSYIYPKIKGDENLLTKPLVISDKTISQDSILYFQAIEPTFCTPTTANFINPLTQDFYIPDLYNAMGINIHANRLLKFVHNPLPDLLKPVYYFVGLSLTQKILQAVNQFNDIKDTILKIVNRYNLSVLKVSLNSFNSNPQGFIERLKSFNKNRDNFGTFAVDKETEDFMQLQMSLTGLDDLLSRYAELLCIETQIPATKLLGISPRGFTANDETAHRNWYDNINGLRETRLKPVMLQIVKLLLLNKGLSDELPIDIQFNNLMESNKLEDAQIEQINNTIDMNNLSAGVITPEEVRNNIISDENNHYSSLSGDVDLEAGTND